jgi:hypothetical protein
VSGKASLKQIMEALEKQKPVILHDAHDTGSYILFLKDATEATLDINTRLPSSHPMAGDRLVDGHLKATKPVLVWLIENHLMTYPPAPQTLSLEGRHITGVVMPGGQQAISAVQKLCDDNGIKNPISVFESAGTIDMVLSAQGIGTGMGGRA